jgi:hypothetical protein
MVNPLTQAYSGGGGGSAPSPGAARRPSGSRGGGRSVGVKSTDATKDAIRTMQQLMGKLNTDMQTGIVADNALERIKAANGGNAPAGFDTADKIKESVRSWGATSAGGTQGSYDGIWGRNTKAQLENIKKFIADSKLPGMIIQEGAGASPSHDMEPANLKKMAEDNIANLVRLFESLGMSAPSIGGQGGNLSSFPLDRIKSELMTDDATAPQPWPEHAGDVRVTVGDMRSLVRFFQFIQQLKYTQCRPLEDADRSMEERSSIEGATRKRSEKVDLGYVDDLDDIETLAEIILDGSLVRLGYSGAQHGPAPEAATSGGQWHCFYTVDEIFRWFASRARMVLAQIQDLIAERKPHPFYPDRLVNAQDEAAATAYLAAANGLWEQWSGMKRNILRQIQQRGNADHPQVTLDMIMDGGAGNLQTPGASRRRGEGDGSDRSGRGTGAETISDGGEDSISQRTLRGPIREFMPLNWLLSSNEFKADTDKLEELSRDGRIPDIHRQIWRQGNWTNLAIQSIEGNSDTEKMQKFPQWAGAIRDVLYDLYANWEYEYRDKLSEQIIAQQNRELNRWGDAITSIISRAQRGMADAVSRYGERGSRRSWR